MNIRLRMATSAEAAADRILRAYPFLRNKAKPKGTYSYYRGTFDRAANECGLSIPTNFSFFTAVLFFHLF